MKLVQIIRPLFLTAVGLHALVLFVPIGPSEPETAVIEDAEFEPLSDKTTATSPAAGGLPVPDPNVSTGAPTGTAAIRAAKTPMASTSATAATSVPAIAARRPAIVATHADSRPTPSRPTATTRQPANSSATQPNTSSDASSRPATDRNTAQTATTDQGASFIAVLEEASDPGEEVQSSQDSQDSQRSDRTLPNNSSPDSRPSQSSGPTSPVTIGALLSDVTRQLPDSLRTFANQLNRSLAYSAKDTDEESANQARENWQANVQKQANVGQIERLPPAEITELTQINYPIESSVNANGQLLNRCLEKDPHGAEIGVLFDSQGNVVDQPIVLRSTGYSALNDEIRAIVAAYNSFPEDRASKAYAFEVDVFYDSDACVSLGALKEE